MRNLLAAPLAISAFVACSSSPSGTEPGETFGRATMALAQVPSDVACVRVTVTGSRSATRLFDATPGAGATFALSLLPLGDDVFSAGAFAEACTAVTDASIPNWVGESVTVTVAVGALADVHLVLRRNGRAAVSIDFDDDGGSGCEGGCSPACVAGQTRCNGNTVEICSPSGQWQSTLVCPGACVAGACN